MYTYKFGISTSKLSTWIPLARSACWNGQKLGPWPVMEFCCGSWLFARLRAAKEAGHSQDLHMLWLLSLQNRQYSDGQPKLWQFQYFDQVYNTALFTAECVPYNPGPKSHQCHGYARDLNQNALQGLRRTKDVSNCTLPFCLQYDLKSSCWYHGCTSTCITRKLKFQGQGSCLFKSSLAAYVVSI